MKKFISMTMAAIMAASIVPSTAFAADPIEINEVKIVGEDTISKNDSGVFKESELQMEVEDAWYSSDSVGETVQFSVILDKAEWKPDVETASIVSTTVKDYDANTNVSIELVDEDEIEVTMKNIKFKEEDKIYVKLSPLYIELTSKSVGTKATVKIDGDEDFNIPASAVKETVFVEISDADIAVSIDEITEVAVEDYVALKEDIEIEGIATSIVTGQEFKLVLNNDFEFYAGKMTATGDYTFDFENCDNNEVIIKTTKAVAKDEIFRINGEDIVIEAVDAKAGDIAKITVKAIKDKDVTGSFSTTSKAINVIEVVADKVKVFIDEDEDIPVMYSGVDNEFNNEDHDALKVTIEEVTVGSWDTKDAWSISLPEGVYVTNETKNQILSWNMKSTKFPEGIPTMFEDAYANKNRGDFEGFEFPRNSIEIDKNEKAKIEFTLNLIAEPGFEGDVDLTFDNGEFKETVTIAKFVKPYNIEVKQNDVAVDYRYTALESGIIVTEPEEDLWVNGTTFDFKVEKDYIKFEDTEKYISNFDVKENSKSAVGFTVKEQSDEEPFKVEIKDLSVYMDRNLPAGGYDLEVLTSIDDKLFEEKLLSKDNKTYDDVIDEDKIVIENFINIVTGDADTFVTKVEVPVGKDYIKAGDKVFALDVPAYINAENYTMLPVRAVAVALGIDNDAIIWNAETHTATIFYGSRIISMTVGADVMTVNGTTIPTATSVEVINGRMFIPMRDLATAMNARLDWDPVTRTAYFN